MLIPNKHNGYSGGIRRLCMPDDDDDGGGGGAAATQTVYQNQIPRFAPEVAPYAQTLLGQAAALTDTGMNPYMQYQGERIAQFSPLQNQSYENMALMQSQPQLQDATALAGQAGLGALNTQYTFDPSNFNKAFGAATTRDAKGNVTGNTMMNPYMDNVVARQQQDASRQAAIAGQAQQAQAARSGAFGGSGDYLMRGQAAGNLARQKGDIQAQGLNNAYNQAMQQYNNQYQQNAQQQQYGAGLGLQGLQVANQSAQNLGTLGGLQYQQNMGINQMQNQYGLQQQAQVQQDLNNKYQDYLNSQNFPYKQMGFMSDMIRGLPLGQQSTQTMYPQAPPPSAIQSIGAAGMGLYGASKLFGKEGGLMKSYAGGGVTSQQSIESILNKLSDQQLQQAKEAALNRRDVEQANMIDAELAERASIRGGLGSAFNQIPEEQQEQMMAGGGVVAFQDRGLVEDDEVQTEVSPVTYQQYLDSLANIKYKRMPAKAYNEAILARRKALEDGAGPSPYADYESKISGMETEDAKGLEQAKGLAALAAIPAMLRGNNAIRGIGGAGGAFASAYGQALQADKAQKRSMMNTRFNLADAQRKERMALTRDSISAADQDRKDNSEEQMFEVRKAQAIASTAARLKPKTATPNFDINAQAAIASDLKSVMPMKKGETPDQYDARINAAAYKQILELKGTKDITSRGTVTSSQVRDIVPEGAEAGAKADTVAASLTKDQEAAVVNVKKSIPYLQAMKAKDSAAMQKMEEDARAGVVSGFEKSRQQVNPGAKPAAPAAQPLPANPKDPKSYKDGVVYSTSKGPGKWNAKTQKFTVVP